MPFKQNFDGLNGIFFICQYFLISLHYVFETIYKNVNNTCNK